MKQYSGPYWRIVSDPGGRVSCRYASTSFQSGGMALNIHIEGANRTARRTVGAPNLRRPGLTLIHAEANASNEIAPRDRLRSRIGATLETKRQYRQFEHLVDYATNQLNHPTRRRKNKRSIEPEYGLTMIQAGLLQDLDSK